MSEHPCPSCGGPADAGSGVCPRCATQVHNTPSATAPAGGAAASEVPSVPPEIPGYEILGQLGEGGMGAVYLAEETALGRRVAIKIISRRVAADAQSKARFLREARTLATIEHPHVVRVYSFGEVDGQPYLVMEYVEGETLADRMARLGKLGIEEATRIVRDIIDALDAAWERKVVHRDIKPSNILIDRRNRVRVADFGLAKPVSLAGGEDASLTLTGYMVGTPHYVSPEQAQGSDSDFRTDFYSVGVLLFHMLTGQRPFDGPTPFAIVAKHMHEPLPSIRGRRTDVPPQLEHIAQWLAQKDPAKRPSSHSQVISTLDAMISHTPSAPMPSFTTIAIEKPRRSAAMIAAAVALLLIAGSIGAWFLSRLKPPTVSDANFKGSGDFVVAVAPFYGPDEDSAKEGRVMAAMIERAIAQRLGTSARVLGIEETKKPVRNDEEARALGQQLRADAVIWGEAFALRNETEIQPHVALITKPKADESGAAAGDPRLLTSRRTDPMAALEEKGGGSTLKLEAEAPNQIELRKMSASGVGDLVLVLAGIHALENEKDAKKALTFFEQTPESAETLRYRVQALLKRNEPARALPLLERATSLDPQNTASQALLGDLYLTAGRVPDAIAAYARAAATGQPFTTARGILFEGRLYRSDTYSTHLGAREEKQTLYLLALDPASLRVLERYSMPGLPAGFRIDGDTLVIRCNAERGSDLNSLEVRLRQGRFDRPLWPPPSLLMRMTTVKRGWAPASNFMEAFEVPVQPGQKAAPPFKLRQKYRVEDRPKTLPELEKAMRDAIGSDPTQPWNHFWLAVALREQKRTAEANAAIEELVRRPYPHVPYYEFSWMLGLATRMRAHQWEAPLWTKVVAQRRLIPQPPDFSTLIERLINAPFVRQAAHIENAEQGYVALQRARALALSLEGEDLVAAAWARDFERRGDARAANERALVRRAHAHPFNFSGVNAEMDYLLAASAAVTFAFVVLTLLVVWRAFVRMRRHAPVPPSAVVTRTREWLVHLPRTARLALTTLAGGLLVSLLLWAMAIDAIEQFLMIVVAALLLMLLARTTRLSPRALVMSVDRGERRALAISWTILAAVLLWSTDRLLVFNSLWGIPIGMQDAIGHPTIVGDFEKLVSTRGEGDANLRYVTAVANHYAGNAKRAEELYGTLPPGFSNSAANRAALGASKMPAKALTAEELFGALTGTRLSRWRGIRDVNQFHIFPAVLVAGLVLLLVFLLVPATAPTDDRGVSRIGKILAFVIPGLYDVQRSRPGRALALLAAIGFVLPTAISFAKFRLALPSIGPLTAMGLPNLTGAFPLPSAPNDGMTFAMILAYPHAPLYLAALAIAALAALALHLSLIPHIARERTRADDAVTVTVPAME